MAGLIPFTNNYTDCSTNEGYQFEFHCMRCGNGYRSKFRHSVTGFGGRIAAIGGGLFGGAIGERASEAGWASEYMRSGSRGSTDDKHLREAVADVQPFFTQCHRCGQWVCNQICWNAERGLCVTCAPKLDQEIAGMQAQAQMEQLNTKIQSTDWTQNVNFRDQGTGRCPKCGAESGGGKFCAGCGAPLAAAPDATKKFCQNCGSDLKGSKFCGECGSAAT